MLNHIHLIIHSPDVGGFVRNFKTYTSKELKKNIIESEHNILRLFEENNEYHFWQKTNMPELIISENFYFIKANYIESNPVRKQYVKKLEDWFYSSANKADNLLKLETV